MRRAAWWAMAVPLLAVAVGGCSLDDVMHKIPWFGSMIRQPSIKPYAMPRPLPEGTVPITGGEPDWQWPTTDLSFVNSLRNPRQRTAESLTRGEEQYQIYCSVCHGPTGGGDGPVAPVFPGVRPLNTERTAGLSDGYIYSIIRYGTVLMPRYGDKIRATDDRWDVVNYMRQLRVEAR